jgi:hypothetical protein
MAQTKPKAAQFYGVSGNGTAGQVLISDGNGGMSWGANTETFTVSWATPTGQSLTYTQPNPQSSSGAPGGSFTSTIFTATKSGEEISGTATIAGLPTGITATQSLSGSGANNVLTVTLTGVFPGSDSLNTALTLSGLTVGVPLPPLIVNYLVIAGGGGGGSHTGGGGGAGGLRTSYGSTTGGGGSSETQLTLVAGTNYTVTIGAGGAGGLISSNFAAGIKGLNSLFSTITSEGGGFGGGHNANGPAGNGGSGGGAGVGSPGSSSLPGGNAQSSPVQGYNGGAGFAYASPYPGGGGGGAGVIGANSTSSGGGAGGNGLTNSINASSLTYAGGGGGSGSHSGGASGPGGTGGGGAGGIQGTPAGGNGTTSTGSGGGGGGNQGDGGSGGSGIVILRYPSAYTISGLSGSTTTIGSDKVTTFTNAGTGNIQFN